PPGHHPGPCAVLGMLGDRTVLTHDSYLDGRVATERQEEWSILTSVEATRRLYIRTDVENGYHDNGRLSRAIKRPWSRVEPNWQSDSAAWEQTDYIYGIHQSSTRRMAARRYQGSPPTAPQIAELDDFVVDALGKVIPTRQTWFDGRGGGYSRQIGL